MKKQINIMVLGESGVGKTKYTNHLVRGEAFDPAEVLPATIGTDGQVMAYHVDALDETVQLYLMDFSGSSESSLLMIPALARNADIVFLIFDLTRRRTFEQLAAKWAPHCLKSCHKDPLYIIIGNKLDLVEAKPKLRAVFEDEITAFAKSIKAAHTYQLSAIKTADDGLDLVREPINIALTDWVERRRRLDKEAGVASAFTSGVVALTDAKGKKEGCC